MGGGVCGAIFYAAGQRELQAACDRLAPIRVGEAAITPGFALPARYVIHAVGPVYHSLIRRRCRRLLAGAYESALKLAAENACESVAFPLLSSGIYGYPKEEALLVARQSIEAFLKGHEMQVYLAVFDPDSFQVSKALLGRVESYIDGHYVKAHTDMRRRSIQQEAADLEQTASFAFPMMASAAPALSELLEELDEPFSQSLLRLIDQKGKTDVEVYKRANLDRKLFSKIRTGKGYTPKKPTILALAVALELSLPETDALLKKAGYALSHSSRFDVIVEYFIVNGNYDIFQINEVLFAYDQPLLGA